jgi:hypothetical protein
MTPIDFEKYDYLRTTYGPIILSEELERKLIQHLYLDTNLDILKHVRFNANNRKIIFLLRENNHFAPDILAYLIETGQLNPYFEVISQQQYYYNLVELYIRKFITREYPTLQRIDDVINENNETILSFFEIFSSYDLKIRNKEFLIEDIHIYYKIIDMYEQFCLNKQAEKEEIKRISGIYIAPPELVDIIGRNVMIDAQAGYVPPEGVEFSFGTL